MYKKCGCFQTCLCGRYILWVLVVHLSSRLPQDWIYCDEAWCQETVYTSSGEIDWDATYKAGARVPKVERCGEGPHSSAERAALSWLGTRPTFCG